MSSIGKLMNPIPNLNHLFNPVQVFKDIKKNPLYAFLPPGSKGAVDQIRDTGRVVAGYRGAPGTGKNERGLFETPPTPPPAALPDPGNPDVKRRAIQNRRAAGTGRANTIFSESTGNALGGG